MVTFLRERGGASGPHPEGKQKKDPVERKGVIGLLAYCYSANKKVGGRGRKERRSGTPRKLYLARGSLLMTYPYTLESSAL